ncbi:hypothetical protein [Streptomyces sp. Da 82-17]|uniref:hypothetical protein n=1 Tax=Streptomyces sp. Da 82-17 TaxID=3377116 RepID=UPI0038D4CEEA
MIEPSPACQALAQSYTTGDGRTAFRVTGLTITPHPDRSHTLTYRLAVSDNGLEGEQWEFTLLWDDKAFADVFDAPAPDPERLRLLVHLVRALLEEWWDTKGHDRGSAKMGRRVG